MVSILATPLLILLALAAVSVGLLIGLHTRLREDRKPPEDPQLDLLRRLADETQRRREETLARSKQLRDTIRRNLYGE